MEENSKKLQRIADVIKVMGYKTDAELAKAINLSQGYVSEIVNEKKNVPKTFGQKLEDYLGISRKWFESGEGEMLAAGMKVRAGETERRPLYANAEVIGEIYPGKEETNFRDLGNGKLLMLVPEVDRYTMAGYLEHIQDREFVNGLPSVDMIVDKYHRGRYLSFVIKGDSMTDGTEESIPDGSTVIGREIKKELWLSKFHTHKWDDFIIVHRDGIIVKRIVGHDVEKGEIAIRSLNPDKERYPDDVIFLDDVLQMFNVIEVRIKRKK